MSSEKIGDKLLIITGAGASHDLVDADKITVPVVNKYRPPLTENVLKAPRGRTVEVGESSCIQEILAKHPFATKTGTQYYIKHSSSADAKILEKYLFELKNSKYITDQQQFWAVPYYLQELFFTISCNYLQGGTAISTNYMFLLDKLKSSTFMDIVWLNLNYDLFADYALRAHLKEPRKLDNIDEYMNLETKDGLRIKYTKPHGSVDWWRKIKDKDIKEDAVRAGLAPKDFEGRLEEKIYSKNGGKLTSGEEDFLFPAISAPIGKYEFVCQEHKKEIEKVLNEVDALLCIGFSALDEDILLVMKNMPPIQALMIVNGSYNSGRKALNNITNSGIKINESYGGDDNRGIYYSGFSAYIANEKIEKPIGPYSYR